MSKRFIILILLLTKTKTEIPAFTFTEKYSKIVVKEGEENYGMLRTMAASLSPDKKKILISGKIYYSEKRNVEAQMSLFDIDENFQLLNEKTYTPPTGKAIANQQLLSSDECIIVERDSFFGPGSLSKINFSGTSGTKISEKTLYIFDYLEMSLKLSKNLVIVTTDRYPSFYKIDDGSLLFPTSSKMYSQIFPANQAIYNYDEMYIYSHIFHPEDSSSQVMICGYQTFFGVIDTSKLSATVPVLDDSSLQYGKLLYSVDTSPKYITHTPSFQAIEYNHKKSTEFVVLTDRAPIGYYFAFETSSITHKGKIQSGSVSLNYGAIGKNVKNIIDTDYFLTVFNFVGHLIAQGNNFGIIDVGTIAEGGIIDYMLITDLVVPDTGFNQPIPVFIERIDSNLGYWIFGGASKDKALENEEPYGGWYKILQLNDPYKPPQKCHDDCTTCINEYTLDPLNCLTCSDSKKILGPTGCKCSANCLSCSENDNSLKCKACSKGYYLKDDNDDGLGECIEGETSLSNCNNDKKNLEDEKNTLTDEKEALTTEKTKIQENLDTCTKQKNALEEEKTTLTKEKNTLTDEKTNLEDKIKNLEEKNGSDNVSGNGGESQQKAPYTTINGVTFPGCVLSNKETGLCKMCARGYAKDTTGENEDATKCTWCGVEGCDRCIVRQGDGKKLCVECLKGLKLQEKNGVQTCFGYFLRLGIFLVIFCWISNY